MRNPAKLELQEDSDQNQEAITIHGGLAPPGYGAVEQEESFWRMPRFSKHPITKRLEAIEQGLFFRMWPNHVNELITMHREGWPHVEIVRTAKELWKRQQDQNKQNQELVEQHREQMSQKRKEQAEEIQSYLFGAGESEQEEYEDQYGEEGFERSLSMDSNESYQQRLSNYRGLFEGKPTKAKNIREKNRGKKRLGGLAIGSQQGWTFQKAESKGPYVLPDLPYSYDALEPVVSEMTMRLHHSVHHAKYVEKLNELVGDTEYSNHSPESLLLLLSKEKDQNIVNQCGGHINHSLLWKTLNPNGGKLPAGSKLKKAVNQNFGSWEKMLKKIKETAADHFGAGWVWLVVLVDGELDIYSTKNQDSPILFGHIPICGIDLWEHSYYVDHGPNKKKYVDEILTMIDWKVVSDRYDVALNEDDMKKFGDVTGFQVYIEKADTTGGERLLTPEQERKKREMTFTRKETGVLNAAPNTDPEEQTEVSTPIGS